MPFSFRAATGLRRSLRALLRLLAAATAIMTGGAVAADTLTGRAMIDTRMALPPGLTFEAVIEDISRADAAAQVIARTVIENPGQPPIDFTIAFDPADLRPGAIYNLRATIRRGDALTFTTDTITRVLTDGVTGSVEVRLRPVARSSGVRPAPIGAHGLSLPASFTGTLPCADCEGVRHHLDLWADQVYHLRRDWLDRPEGPMRRDETGRWYADPARGAIVLYGTSEMPLVWEVKGPDRLRQTDIAGKPIASDLPLELTSDGKLSPTDLEGLFLSGEVLIGPDGPALRGCLTGRVYPITTDAAYPELLAAVEAGRADMATPLLVSLEAGIAHPPPGLAPQFPRLTVLRFVNAFPGEACARPESRADLVNTYWRIDSLLGAALGEIETRREPHLVLQGAPGARFRATLGCNQLVGGYESDGDSLTFGAVAMTRMACPPPLDALERKLSQALAATRRLRLEADRLELLRDDGTVQAELRAVYHLR